MAPPLSIFQKIRQQSLEAQGLLPRTLESDRGPSQVPVGGNSIFQRIRNTRGRRESLTSPERYQLAAKANKEAGFMEQAGVVGLSAFLKILDVINTPQQMFFGAAIGLIEGENIIAAAIDGARENLMGSDLLKALDVPELGSVNLPIIGKVTGRGVLGLPLDLLIDIPIFGALGKAARLAKIPVLAKYTQKSIVKGGRSLREKGLVIPKIADRRLAKGKPAGVGQEFLDSMLGQYRPFQSKNERILFDLIQQGKRISKGKQGLAKKVAFEFGVRAEKIAKKQGISVNVLGKQLLDIIERKTGKQGVIRGSKLLDDFKLRPDGRVFGDHFDSAGKKIAAKVDPAVTKIADDLVDAGYFTKVDDSPFGFKVVSNKTGVGNNRGTSFASGGASAYRILDKAGQKVGTIEKLSGPILKSGKPKVQGGVWSVTIFEGDNAIVNSFQRFKDAKKFAQTGRAKADSFLNRGALTPSLVLKARTTKVKGTAPGEETVKNLVGKQTTFPVANDVAQLRTAKEGLKAERDAFLAQSRKARDQARHPFKLTPDPSDAGSIKDLGFDNIIRSQHGDEIYDLAMSAKQLFQDGVLQEINHGVATLSLDDVWLDYMTHYLLPAAKTKLLSARTAGALEFTNASRLRVYNPNHSFQLLRKWDGMTVNELNALGKGGLLPGFEGVIIDQLFTTDISTILAARMTRGIKAITDADIFTNAARQLGRHVDDVPAAARENFRKLAITANQDERLKPLGAYMNNYLFEKDVARHLDSYFSTMQNPRGMHPFLAKIDRIQGVWKASTLFMFPAYHSRNFIGNLWNNHLKDATMWMPNRFGKAGYYSAAAAWTPIRSAVTPLKEITLGGVKYTRRQMDDLLEKHGINNQFREFLAIPEVGIGVKTLPGGEFLGKIPGVGRATERGILIGSWIEDHARRAHFFSVLDKSKKTTAALRAREAAMSTKLHLFNYDELNDFEQTWLRRAMPFFAWTRNNLPLQVRNIVSQPQKFSQLKDIIDFVEGEKTPPRGEDVLIQKWMKRNSPVRTRVDGDGNAEYFLLGGWLPAADIGKIAEPWKILMDELSPFLKEPVEQLINFDTFLQREITEFPGQKRKFIGVNISTRFVGVLRNIRLLSLIDSIGASVEGAIQGEGKTGIFSDATAKPIQEMILAQTVGFQIREVTRAKGARGVIAQMAELKTLLRRELRAGRVANAERVKDELIDLTKRLQR